MSFVEKSIILGPSLTEGFTIGGSSCIHIIFYHIVIYNHPVHVYYSLCFYFPHTVDKPMVMPGDDTSLILTLKKDLPLEVNQRFTLREGHMTVGTGVITEIVQ